jgi:hypothetical protein
MPSLDVLRATTTNSAEMLGWQEGLARLSQGSSPISWPFAQTLSPTFMNWSLNPDNGAFDFPATARQLFVEFR